MARRVKEATFVFPGKGRPVGTSRPVRHYPWKRWMNGEIWEIVQGTDFDVDRQSMRSNLYVAAQRQGASGVQTVFSGEKTIRFQAYDV